MLLKLLHKHFPEIRIRIIVILASGSAIAVTTALCTEAGINDILGFNSPLTAGFRFPPKLLKNQIIPCYISHKLVYEFTYF